MKYFLLFFFGLSLTSAIAQKQDYVWCFGDSAGIDFNNLTNPTPISCSMRTFSCAASISNSDGQLLFYAGGSNIDRQYVSVYNRNHQLMKNGSSLIGVYVIQQGLIIIPFPTDSLKYYLFSLSLNGGKSMLYYSIIDMSLEGGLGEVIIRDQLAINDSLTDKMQAVKHANGRDWWVVTHRYNSDKFYRVLITHNGVQSPDTQHIGSLHNAVDGPMFFSQDGSMLAGVSWTGMIDLFDFDRCSGQLSNFRDLGEHIIGQNEYAYDACAFSANGTRLYVTSNNITGGLNGINIYQYDLNSPNIKGSKQTIWSYNDTAFVSLGELMLGPDNKIYVGNYIYPPTTPDYPYYPSKFHNKYNQNLSVINHPDSLGIACNFTPYSFYLGGKRSYGSLPNMPNYNLGCLQGSTCGCWTEVKENKKDQLEFTIYPNPNNGFFNLKFNNIGQEKYSIQIIDMLGKVLTEKETSALKGLNDYMFNLSHLQKGIYYVKLKSANEELIQKLVIED